MDLQFNEEQKLMQAQAREFMDKQCPLERVRELWEGAQGMDDGLWQAMAGMGWLGMLVPEQFGGMGLTTTDTSRVLEELGRGLLPGPLLAHLLGTQAIALAGHDAQREEWLPALVEGTHKVALVRRGEGGRDDELGGAFQAQATAQGHTLRGAKAAVAGAAQAQTLVVAAALEGTTAWFLVDAGAPGVTITPLRAIEEGIKQATVRLDGVALTAERRLAGDLSGDAVLAQVSHLCDVALAFDALGGAERAMDMAVEYAKVRETFGQPIGSYQAIKHQCADMLYDVESLRAIALWAAWVLDVPEAERSASAGLAAAMARATAIETYDRVVRRATQVHGGIATTEEHQMHLFAKRSRILALSFGSIAHYQEIILRENGFSSA